MIRHAFFLLSAFLAAAPRIDAGPWVAFSLGEAERRLGSGRAADPETRTLGGITDLAGLVLDAERDDIIVVGQANRGRPGITLDDLAVALRSVFVHGASPLVSIDRTPATAETGKHAVRFEGGIEDTRLGLDMLEADVILKRIALGKLSARVWGAASYVDLVGDDLEKGGGEDHVASRFWFLGRSPSAAVRDGVFGILELDVGIETEVLGAVIEGKAVEELSAVRDSAGDRFAASIETALDDLAVQHRAVARARPILAVVALARGFQALSIPADRLAYWLHRFPVERVETPRDFPLLAVEKRLDDRKALLTITGGVRFDPIVVRLESGDVTALRDAVLESRPAVGTLLWHPPLDGWRIPGAEDVLPTLETHAATPGEAGFSIDRFLAPSRAIEPGARAPALESGMAPRAPSLPPRALESALFRSPLPAPRAALPRLELTRPAAFAPPAGGSTRDPPRIGGVLLRGAAAVEGGSSRVALGGGTFSLIVGGKDARLDPGSYRRLITSLWSTYFTEQDPGISIDPIAPGIEKHLVRYIGQVINTDLGRVMREADYIMKKWAVGTERPDIPGFKDLDALSARFGINMVGASRRFWFVPEGISFKEAGGMLLFDRGRMTLQTEYLFQGQREKAEPADREFARTFTDRYDEIAARHPVYQELFEYAKLVSLSKYLKEREVPLLWFLLAHKDLVITEDSPGTVAELARGSEHYEGITIKGGVELVGRSSYVWDAEAMRALEKARSRLPPARVSPAGPSAEGGAAPSAAVPGRFSFELADNSYTVVPQHTLTCGRDRRGLRYQTDLALRRGKKPGLELVRYYDPSRPEGGEFGEGWRLLVPYRIRPEGKETREVPGAVIPGKMAVENLLSGETEVLAFSEDRYGIAGYVPENVEGSHVVGLFIMTDASYRLADKIGNELWFDPAGQLTDLRLSSDYRLHIEYEDGFSKAFDEPPYRVDTVDHRRVPFLNAYVPERLRVTDLSGGPGETLRFSAEGRVAGYVPEDGERSRHVLLAVLSNGAFRLLDRRGNEVAFRDDGSFEAIQFSHERPMVRSLSLGDQRVEFGYRIDALGQPRIARARVTAGAEEGSAAPIALRYDLDDGGRLAGVERVGAARSAGSSD